MAPLSAELASGSAPACKVCAYMSNLAPSERQEWENGFADGNVRNAALLSALRRRGVTLTEASVRRHRGSHVAAR